MGQPAIMKDRFFSNVKSFGSSIRMMWAARKKLPKTQSAFYLFFMLLPILSVVFVSNPIFALTWLLCLFIYIPLLESYAYAVVNG
jgi:hypothetical protein